MTLKLSWTIILICVLQVSQTTLASGSECGKSLSKMPSLILTHRQLGSSLLYSLTAKRIELNSAFKNLLADVEAIPQSPSGFWRRLYHFGVQTEGLVDVEATRKHLASELSNRILETVQLIAKDSEIDFDATYEGNSLLTNVLSNWTSVQIPRVDEHRGEASERLSVSARPIVEWLITHGASPTLTAAERSPLEIAVSKGDFDSAAYLATLPEYRQLAGEDLRFSGLFDRAVAGGCVSESNLRDLLPYSRPSESSVRNMLKSGRPDLVAFFLGEGQAKMSLPELQIFARHVLWEPRTVQGEFAESEVTRATLGMSVELHSKIKMLASLIMRGVDPIDLLQDAASSQFAKQFTSRSQKRSITQIIQFLLEAGANPISPRGIRALHEISNRRFRGAEQFALHEILRLSLQLGLQKNLDLDAEKSLEQSNLVDRVMMTKNAWPDLALLAALGFRPRGRALQYFFQMSPNEEVPLNKRSIEKFLALFPDTKVDEKTLQVARDIETARSIMKEMGWSLSETLARQAECYVYLTAISRRDGVPVH